MSYMKDRIFIDTNLFVYAYLDTNDKAQQIKHLNAIDSLEKFSKDNKIIISTQVLSEYYSALLKNKINDQDIQHSANLLINSIEISPITKYTITESYTIKNKYRYSYWDSLIITSALQAHCTTLYSEDMQHQQKIEGTLTIINPFLS